MRIGLQNAWRRCALIATWGLSLWALQPSPVQAADAVGAMKPSQGCADLAGRTAPSSAFALPTGSARITEAVMMNADAKTGMPAFCRVRGAISAKDPNDPSILFQVNLPNTWNRKTVEYGGGGTNGVVIEATGPFAGGGGAVTPALARGYVTYGGDSGHQGPGREFFFNPQALANYSHEAIKRDKDFVSWLVRAYYGVDARRNYHIGGSKGGQEGLQAVQRYFADFDGVVAYYPAAENQALQLGWNRLWHFAFDPPGGALNKAKQALLKSAVMAACDGLDGAKDGIVSNPAACATTFKVASLRCPQGQDAGDGCLSDRQIAALEQAARRFDFAWPMPNGVQSIGPWPALIGGDLNLWFGDGVDGSQQAFYRWPAAGPEAVQSTGVDRGAWDTAVMPIASVYDASNPDIDGFHAKGGKLLLVQGTTDMLVPTAMTTDYFGALTRRYGADLSRFVRYYIAPGYGHGGGAFKVQWDSLAALDAWVEAGTPPVDPVAVDGNPGSGGRSRPLCEYPTWPKYKGAGSIDQAGSFVCAR